MRLLLGGNQISGAIWPDWKDVNPEVFSVRGNQLTGALPKEFGWAWKATAEFDAARNNLTGALPGEWGALARLERLDLSYNAIGGSLPPAWAPLLPKVKSLFLTRNKLRGSIPGEWGAATAGARDFWRFDVRNNVRLKGCLPKGMERFLASAEPFASVYLGGTLVNRTC